MMNHNNASKYDVLPPLRILVVSLVTLSLALRCRNMLILINLWWTNDFATRTVHSGYIISNTKIYDPINLMKL